MVDETQNTAEEAANTAHEEAANTAHEEAANEIVVTEMAPSAEPETTVLDLTDSATEPDAADATADTPDVDELEVRLADLQSAMDQLQAGDLDGAEAAVAALEEQLAATRELQR